LRKIQSRRNAALAKAVTKKKQIFSRLEFVRAGLYSKARGQDLPV
jgi:hypothetical protein